MQQSQGHLAGLFPVDTSRPETVETLIAKFDRFARELSLEHAHGTRGSSTPAPSARAQRCIRTEAMAPRWSASRPPPGPAKPVAAGRAADHIDAEKSSNRNSPCRRVSARAATRLSAPPTPCRGRRLPTGLGERWSAVGVVQCATASCPDSGAAMMRRWLSEPTPSQEPAPEPAVASGSGPEATEQLVAAARAYLLICSPPITTVVPDPGAPIAGSASCITVPTFAMDGDDEAGTMLLDTAEGLQREYDAMDVLSAARLLHDRFVVEPMVSSSCCGHGSQSNAQPAGIHANRDAEDSRHWADAGGVERDQHGISFAVTAPCRRADRIAAEHRAMAVSEPGQMTEAVDAADTFWGEPSAVCDIGSAHMAELECRLARAASKCGHAEAMAAALEVKLAHFAARAEQAAIDGEAARAQSSFLVERICRRSIPRAMETVVDRFEVAASAAPALRCRVRANENKTTFGDVDERIAHIVELEARLVCASAERDACTLQVAALEARLRDALVRAERVETERAEAAACSSRQLKDSKRAFEAEIAALQQQLQAAHSGVESDERLFSAVRELLSECGGLVAQCKVSPRGLPGPV